MHEVRFQNSEFLVWVVLLVAVYVIGKSLLRNPGHSLVHRFTGLPLEFSSLELVPEALFRLAFFALLLTLLEPVLPLSKIRVVSRGLDIVMLVDLSSSMQEYLDQGSYVLNGEASATKLEAVKEAISQFLSNREGDRMGALVFSEGAYVVSPPTVDYAYLTDYLKRVDFSTLSGEGRTAIGEAIFAGLGLLQWKDPMRDSPAVMMVFTDGESNAGRSVYEALAQARKDKVRVYLIGLSIWYLTEPERLTRALVDTGGAFFEVTDSDALKEAYRTIDILERQQLVTDRYVRNEPFYQPFLILSLVSLLTAVLLKAFPRFLEIT